MLSLLKPSAYEAVNILKAVGFEASVSMWGNVVIELGLNFAQPKVYKAFNLFQLQPIAFNDLAFRSEMGLGYYFYFSQKGLYTVPIYWPF